jgi:hypothetical protein
MKRKKSLLAIKCNVDYCRGGKIYDVAADSFKEDNSSIILPIDVVENLLYLPHSGHPSYLDSQSDFNAKMLTFFIF